VVRCEVGRGLRQSALRAKFAAFWDVMLNVQTDNRLWAQAEQVAWELDRKGAVLPLTDVVIACCARRVGAVVLTLDKHFHDIPGAVVINQPPV
jgi:predicted nucleic acid-binding protein